MAITTQGHQVSVMPQYVAPNPGLLAFNPQQISQGVLSSIQIANEIARRNAFLAQQEELAATRDARIAQQLAQSGIVTGTAQGQIAGTNAQNQSLVNRLPAADAAAIAQANQLATIAPAQTPGMLASIAFEDRRRPVVQAAQLIQDESNEALAFKRADLAAAQLAAQEQLVPVQAQLTLEQAQQALSSITEDKRLTDAQKLAQIRNLNASARASEAQAAYTERDRPRGGAQDNVLNNLRDVQMQIQALEKAPVVNPNLDNEGMPVPLIQYQAQTRGPNGMPLVVDAPGLFTGDTTVSLNPEAERRAAELKSLYDLRNALTAQVTGGAAPASAQRAATPAAGPAQITTKAQFDALPIGAPFIFNGKQGIKTK